jgi:hypothetical protein
MNLAAVLAGNGLFGDDTSNMVVAEIEHGASGSLFVTIDADAFDRDWDRLLVQFAAFSSPVHYRIHDGQETTGTRSFPTSRSAVAPTGLPAVLTAFHHPCGAVVLNPVTVERVDGAHPSHVLGSERWARISAGLARSGLAVEYEGRQLRGIWPRPALSRSGIDLAVACALLADAGQLEPTLFDRALFSARLDAEGFLLPVAGPVDLAVRAATHGLWRLNVAPADRTRILGTGTGLSISGYLNLRALHDSWGT